MSRNALLLEQARQGQVLTPLGMPTPVRAPLSSLVRREGFARDEISRSVRRVFFEGRRAGGPKMLCFCGLAQDDRTSWICARAAEYLASKADASVCLVDADFRTPHLHAQFALDNQPGFAAALAGDSPVRQFVTSVASTNLWLIPAGRLEMGSKRFAERLRYRLAELRKEFDYVFLSGPAFSPNGEALMLGKLTDGMVMVVPTGWVGRRLAQRNKKQLRKSGITMLGEVTDPVQLSVRDALLQNTRSSPLWQSLPRWIKPAA